MSLVVEKISLSDLLNACEKGEHRSQMEIYKRFYRCVFNSAYRILNNKVEAEDIMQEAFFRSVQQIERIKRKRKVWRLDQKNCDQ